MTITVNNTQSSIDSTKLQRYASFATTSRLVACLVSEGLRPAYFVPPLSSPTVSLTGVPQTFPLIGLAIVLRHPCECLDPSTLDSDGLLVVVALRAQPILHPSDYLKSANGLRRFPRIELVDPWEMIGPDILTLEWGTSSIACRGLPHFGNSVVAEPQAQYLHQHLKDIISDAVGQNIKKIQLKSGLDAVQLWESFIVENKVPSKLAKELQYELRLSLDFQKYAYEHPKELPTLRSSTIHWEQCILEGHPTHPVSAQIRYF